MSRLLLISALLLAAGAPLRAQFGNFADKPVEITADGDTRFENGKAVADNNVQIRYGDLAIYADHAEYNPDSRDILLVGNVRIYSGRISSADSAPFTIWRPSRSVPWSSTAVTAR